MDNIWKFYSKWPPFALTTAFNLRGTSWTAARRVSWDNSSHALTRDSFREAIFLWVLAQAFLSKMDYMEKSMGLRSGEEGGHKVLSQKLFKFVSHQFWDILAVCELAPSCWSVHGRFLKCILAAVVAGDNIWSIYNLALILHPSGMKIKGDFQVSDTPAHTITDAGFCRR